MSRKFFVLFSIILFSLVSVVGQVKEPVKWRFELKEVNQYEVQVVAYASIEHGWKMYGLDVPEGGPVPTEFTFEKVDAIRPLKKAVENDKPTVKFDEVFSMEVPFFKEKAVFSQNIRVTKKPVKLKGYVTFMCCNDEMCMPPTDVDFEFDIK
nr:protein-disulfide reductase DsbD domain-containing protein [uncultured Carboxylicivirga sp.]